MISRKILWMWCHSWMNGKECTIAGNNFFCLYKGRNWIRLRIIYKWHPVSDCLLWKWFRMIGFILLYSFGYTSLEIGILLLSYAAFFFYAWCKKNFNAAKFIRKMLLFLLAREECHNFRSHMTLLLSSIQIGCLF